MNDNIGRKGRDRLTGFKGTVAAYAEYISGCHQYLLVPECGEDGKLVDGGWFDLQRVDISGERILLDNEATPGHDKAPPGGRRAG